MHAMEPLTEEFLENCPREDGFRLRGLAMTRIEVFVDAAFAFAVTILVISFDAIPRTFPEMATAIKLIPAFVASVAQLIWIWQTHGTWCQRYGLDDGPTVWLSALLLVVVLVYIYPMRIMLEGLFSWVTNDYLPSSFDIHTFEELRFMFVFLGTAFAALSLTFVLMYRYAMRLGELLLLDKVEREMTSKIVEIWYGCLVIGIAVVLASLLLPDRWVHFSGLLLFLIRAWHWIVEIRHSKAKIPNKDDTND